jgi:protein-tyrosine phosphatase
VSDELFFIHRLFFPEQLILREVIPSQLWIGGVGDIVDPRSLYESGVEAILHLAASTLPTKLSREIVYCRVPIIDGAENSPERLKFVIETGVMLVKNKVPTLIACSAGMSRSPSITAAVLSVIQQKSADEVLEEILKDSPADVSPVLWEAVKTAVQAIHDEPE